MLLDGHTRLLILQDLGYKEAPCLISKDDEAYTYNSRVNRLSSIQEHYMLRRAVQRGVSPERLAKVLSVDITNITRKLALLDNICPEAIEMLKDRQFSPEISRILRKMKPTRQLECVELMIAANNVGITYAQALLAATPVEFLVDGKKPSRLHGVSAEQMARMEREMENLQGQYKLVEENYGQDVLNLVLARGYLAKLLENESVTRYLRQNHNEIHAQFEAIVQVSSLDA
ncbi:flagellar motor switch protein FliM [Novimethylophilus kurashikiensis]|uniref:Flagellar motor switch protein FliM n=2 Tax=Novimethylophilus kurashikiensis TaxID=1825523 RepID=A0A2R5F8N4_9PROT|nr:flagellar motor switch protein FliM [Novimethylophilus kurashikiensis]